jgi:hypothetical protein
MLVYDFVPVESPFQEAAAWLLGAGAEALADAAAATFSAPDGGRLDLGDLRERDDAVVVPFAWSGRVAPGVGVRVEGDLQLAPLGDGRSHLSLSASYDPPVGTVAAADMLRVQRGAEARVREYLGRVACALEAGVPVR